MSETTESTLKPKVSQKGKSKHRSPNYPLFDLAKAVEKMGLVYQVDKTHKVPIQIVHDRLNYKKGSGAGNQAVAALKSFGLVSVEGEGDKRLIAVTENGRKIHLNSPDRSDLLKKCAIGPSLFRTLWDRYRDEGLPSDDVLRHHLIFERNFNEERVDDVIARFKGTVLYAGLVAGDKIQADGSAEDEEETSEQEDNSEELPTLQPGSWVQWTSGGTERFVQPKQIASVTDDGCFAFFSDSPTGIPMQELSLADPAFQSGGSSAKTQTPAKPLPANPFYRPPVATEDESPKGFDKERFTLPEGAVSLTWPAELTSDSVEEFEYWIEGIIRRARRKAGLPPTKK